MSLHEIVLPETEPETEWLRGRAVQKVSPTYAHARLQALLSLEFTMWADAAGRGRVGTEWRFAIAPPGEITRPLVPDIAYLSYAALGADAPFADVQVPRVAPTVAVAIGSPGDGRDDVDHKVALYLAAGGSLVIVVDPATRLVEMHDAAGRHRLGEADKLTHAALPGLAIDLGALFARAASL